MFQRIHCQLIDTDYDLDNDQKSNLLATSDYESHGLTDKELQMFRKLFGYKKPEELTQALIEGTNEKHNDLLNNLKTEQTVLEDQIKTKIGVQRTRLENLRIVVRDILDGVRWSDNIPDLESEESASQRRNELSSGQGLKILTPNQITKFFSSVKSRK